MKPHSLWLRGRGFSDLTASEDPLVIKKILNHLDTKPGVLDSTDQLPEPRAPPQARLFN